MATLFWESELAWMLADEEANERGYKIMTTLYDIHILMIFNMMRPHGLRYTEARSSID